MVTKRCYRCGETKPAAEFYHNTGHRDGLSAACRPCTKAEAHERWRRTHPEPSPYVIPTEKTCSICGITKPLDQFHRHKQSRDGKKSDCAACCIAAAHAWNQKHPEYRRKKATEYRTRHPDRVADCNLMARLGVPRGTYAKMLAAQDGKCAICSATEPGARIKRFHMDHDATTGVVRGLLCHLCNVGIGGLRHDPQILSAAIKYLQVFLPESP